MFSLLSASLNSSLASPMKELNFTELWTHGKIRRGRDHKGKNRDVFMSTQREETCSRIHRETLLVREHTERRYLFENAQRDATCSRISYRNMKPSTLSVLKLFREHTER